MRRPLEDIQERIAEVEKLCEAADARERRLQEVVAQYYAEQAKLEVAGLAPLLEKLRAGPAEINQFFRAQEEEARRRVEAVTPLLQLHKEEIAMIERTKDAILAIDPCGLVLHHSPGWECSHKAFSFGSSHWEAGNAIGSCTCTPGQDNNVFDIKAQAFGQGANGFASAQAKGWFYFNIKARPSAANVTVYVSCRVHGFDILRKPAGSAALKLELSAEAFQYGYSWGSATKTVLNLSADTMGRCDTDFYLQFLVPVGADPFLVKVTAALNASAKSGGAMAVGDFATGAGNYIEITWVNTLSP